MMNYNESFNHPWPLSFSTKTPPNMNPGQGGVWVPRDGEVTLHPEFQADFNTD